MDIRYNVGALRAQKSVDGKPDFLLTNRDGSYYSSNGDVQHGGWFVREQDTLFRVLAEVRIAAPKVSTIEHRLYSVVQYRNDVRENFFLPFKERALVYTVRPTTDVDLVLDVRKTSDESSKRRFYDVMADDDCTLITFTKEDAKPFFIAVNMKGKALNKWEKRYYGVSARAVCRAVRLHGSRFVITAGMDRAQVLRDNNRISQNLPSLVAAQRKYAGTFTRISIDRAVASFALDSFVSYNQGTISGFSEHDELFALRAMLLLGEKDFVWKVLFRQLRALQPNGLLPGADVGSSCLLFLRAKDFLERSQDGRALVEEKLVHTIEKFHAHHTKNGLAWGQAEGARSRASIELQASRLALYKLAFALTKNSLYRDNEEKLRLSVRELFWNGHMLADGLADFTPRTNVFLTAYIYPELLSAEEWKTCFVSVLNALEHCPLADHCVNNIAAIVMHRVAPQFFKNHITNIYSASRDELLWRGCVGMPSEKLDGDVSVLSAATFVELCNELGK